MEPVSHKKKKNKTLVSLMFSINFRGVILYGMVVGQLPFVSARENQVSSQERRKKLLEQINKGLAAPHRKYLAPFSVEFKAMMSRLLVAEASKRISIGELLFHPWITEKGKKAVRSNPFKRLDEKIKNVVRMLTFVIPFSFLH